MGFHEDDRIRAKNRKHNDAYAEYHSYIDKGYSDADIQQICHIELEKPAGIRNEIYSTVLRIVGGSCEENHS